MGLAARGARFVRPLAEAVRGAEATSQEGGLIALLPGDPAGTERMRQLLADPVAEASENALAIMVVRPDTDISIGAPALARRRQSGGGALAIIVGDAVSTARIEARLLHGHHLEPSNIAHVPTLEGEGGDQALDAVMRTLGDEAAPAARRYPGLRPVVGRKLVSRASRRAGIIGVLPLPGVDLPVLALSRCAWCPSSPPSTTVRRARSAPSGRPRWSVRDLAGGRWVAVPPAWFPAWGGPCVARSPTAPPGPSARPRSRGPRRAMT